MTTPQTRSYARKLLFGCALLGPLALLAAGCPPAPPRTAAKRPPPLPAKVAEISFARPEGAPSEAQIVSFARRSVIVSFVAGKDGKPVARYVAVDAAGRPLWVREHGCPEPGKPLTLFPAADAVVCKSERTLHALGLADGASRWTFEAPKALRFAAAAGDRVVVSDAGGLLTVLDAALGKPLRRFALGDSLVGAAGQTPRGPMAFIVEVVKGKPRALLAQSVGGDAVADPPGGAPLAPGWRQPHGGASAELLLSGDVVISRPDGDTVAGHDAATGERRWRSRNSALPRIVAGPTQLAAGGTLAGNAPFVASIAPGTLLARWQQRWPFEEAPVLMSEANGHAAYATAQQWRVYRAADGLPVADGRFSGVAVLGVGGDHAAILTDLEGAREVQVMSYGELPRVRPLPATPAMPEWLVPGARLLYSLLPRGAGEARRLEVYVRAREPQLVLDWRVDDGRRGQRTVSAAALASAERHAAPTATPEAGAASTALCVSQSALRGLQRGEPVALRDVGAAGDAPLVRKGSTLHRLVREAWDHALALDLPAVAASRGADGRYAIATFAELPLVLRARRRDHDMILERVVLPRPGTRPDESALRWPPRCPGRAAATCLAAARVRERKGAVDAAFLLAALAESRTVTTANSTVWGGARQLRNELRDQAFLRVDALARVLDRACRRDRAACLARVALYGDAEAAKARDALAGLCRKRERRACLELAELYVKGRGEVAADPQKAVPLLDDLCQRKTLLGCMVLGGLYAVGSGVKKDPPRALKIWGRACERKLQLGCVALGSAYAQGIGAEKDPARGLELLGQACAAGEPQACFLAGVLCFGGKLIARDASKAAAWFTKGCDAGDAQSCLLLADQHANGDGVTADVKQAEALVQRACDSGERRACVRLRALRGKQAAR